MSTLTKPLDTIKYKPYRGELEPITEVTAAEINFFKDFLELIYNYKLKREGKEDVRRVALTIPRHQLSVLLTTWHDDSDPDEKESPRIELLINGSYEDFIYVKDQKEAYSIYNHIKQWLINEN